MLIAREITSRLGSLPVLRLSWLVLALAEAGTCRPAVHARHGALLRGAGTDSALAIGPWILTGPGAPALAGRGTSRSAASEAAPPPTSFLRRGGLRSLRPGSRSPPPSPPACCCCS